MHAYRYEINKENRIKAAITNFDKWRFHTICVFTRKVFCRVLKRYTFGDNITYSVFCCCCCCVRLKFCLLPIMHSKNSLLVNWSLIPEFTLRLLDSIAEKFCTQSSEAEQAKAKHAENVWNARILWLTHIITGTFIVSLSSCACARATCKPNW